MLRVGLTGGIGSGKSLVGRVLRTLGVPVFEADAEARRLMNTDAQLQRGITERFGAHLLIGGSMDRAGLAAIVFNDTKALADLNALVHPAVRIAFSLWAEAQRAPYVVMESAILAESGGHEAMDRMVSVMAPKELRVRRVMARDGVGEEEVLARMRNQVDDSLREAISDHILHNDETRMLLPQVMQVHEALLRDADSRAVK